MSKPSALLRPYDSILPYKRIEFSTYDGTTLRGNFYRSSVQAQTPSAAVIFCHGLGLVKEQYLENWFKHVLDAGYHVLTYDHRSFGDSDGLPREKFDWFRQAEDFVDAVTFVRTLPEVDENKVFGWGVAHAGGLIAMAAAMDKRIAGIIMFLPCIDGQYDRGLWGDGLWETVQRNRFEYGDSLEKEATIQFWPLTDDEAAGKGDSVLSGEYVRQWSLVGQKMAEQGASKSFTGRLTVSSFWSDFNCRPTEFFDRIAPTPLLWTMATNDIVCGPLEFTKGVYDRLQGPKELCILEGEHLAQYFDPGFPRSVDAMISFLRKYAA